MKNRIWMRGAGLIAILWILRAQIAVAQPVGASREALGFAPPRTDIVFCADIDSLADFLRHRGKAAPAAGAMIRLEELHEGLGLQELEPLHLHAVCTFHIRGTDKQLVVLELAVRLPKWAMAVLSNKGAFHAIRGERSFVLFSKTRGLARSAARQTESSLSPGMRKGTSALAGQRYWAIVEMSDVVRERLQETTGSLRALPEIQELQRIQIVVERLALDDISLNLEATYSSPGEAAQFGPRLGRWLPFSSKIDSPAGEPAGSPIIRSTTVAVAISHVTFGELDKFLSCF